MFEVFALLTYSDGSVASESRLYATNSERGAINLAKRHYMGLEYNGTKVVVVHALPLVQGQLLSWRMVIDA